MFHIHYISPLLPPPPPPPPPPPSPPPPPPPLPSPPFFQPPHIHSQSAGRGGHRDGEEGDERQAGRLGIVQVAVWKCMQLDNQLIFIFYFFK